MGLIAAIDPGREAGVVILRKGRILAATTVKIQTRQRVRRGRVDGPETFGEWARRSHVHALEILAAVVNTADSVGHAEDLELVACEGFDDQSGRYHFSHRWKVPVLAGALEVVFADSTLPSLNWQSAAVLARRGGYGDLYALWKEGRTGLVPGDALLEANEHRASAACHAVWAETTSRPRRFSR